MSSIARASRTATPTTYLLVGKTEEMLRVMERLLSVAPLDLFYRQLRPRNFFFARQYERALAETERLREENPNFVSYFVGSAYFMLSRQEEAHREYVAAFELCGEPCICAQRLVLPGSRLGSTLLAARKPVTRGASLPLRATCPGFRAGGGEAETGFSTRRKSTSCRRRRA